MSDSPTTTTTLSSSSTSAAMPPMLPSASSEDDDHDMTADEVALMVKNALRKARRAMHDGLYSNSSSTDAAKDLPTDNAVNNNNMDHDDGLKLEHAEKQSSLSFLSGGDSGSLAGSFGNDEGDKHPDKSKNLLAILETNDGDATNEDDLARRIEEEIKGARAFAEKVYYGGKQSISLLEEEDATKNVEKTPHSPLSKAGIIDRTVGGKKAGVKSVASMDTEYISNKSPMNRSPPGSNNRGAYTKNSVTMANDKTGNQRISSPVSKKDSGIHGQIADSDFAYTPFGMNNSTDEPEDENHVTIWRRDKIIDKQIYKKASVQRNQPKQSSSNQHNEQSYSKSLSDNPNSPPHDQLNSSFHIHGKSSKPISIKNEHTRENRQVVFRHPYPLPPPPSIPRSDQLIIAEHGVRETQPKFKVVLPDQDLLQLIRAAQDESLVRRSNACGALKVLSSKEGNRAKMCRTHGLLDALVTAAMDDAVDSDALDARTRSVTTILYLSEPKDNRIILARHPDLLRVLVKVVEEDTGEARLRACGTLATLAKTPQNRGFICNTEGLPLVLSKLMLLNVKKPEKDQDSKGNAFRDVSGVEDMGEEGGLERPRTAESRDDSTLRDDDTMDSFLSEDERMLSNTFSGTGTFTEDDFTLQEQDSDEDNSYGESNEEYGYSSGESTIDDGSIQEEEGVEMQISSLKKLNIENHSDFLAMSQLSACATLSHLTKHCANAPILARNDQMCENLLVISSIFDNPLHTRCLEIICNLTRFPSNNARLAANPKVVETLIICGKSKIQEDRMWAIRSIQNLCSDASSKVTLSTGPILSLLSTSAMRKDYEEQYAAVGALMNLSTEPGSIVPLTNTKTVVATLVHLAHSPNTAAAVRKIACDSLATIGLWLQTLASAGTVPEDVPFSPLPTHSATGWLRWDR